MQKYLENISEYIIENYVDIEYCETISGYEKEIFNIKFNNITKKFLKMLRICMAGCIRISRRFKLLY